MDHPFPHLPSDGLPSRDAAIRFAAAAAVPAPTLDPNRPLDPDTPLESPLPRSPGLDQEEPELGNEDDVPRNDVGGDGDAASQRAAGEPRVQ